MRLPLANSLASRDGSTGKDEGSKNAVVETDGDSSALITRPGVDSLGAIGTGAGQMLAAYKTSLKAIVGDAFKDITVTTSATVNSSAAMNPIFPGLPFDYQVQAGAGGKMVIKTNKEAWIYTP